MGAVILIVLFFLAGGVALLEYRPAVARAPSPQEMQEQHQLEGEIGTCDWKREKALTTPNGKFAGCAPHTIPKAR
jgi:hypothetical protein